MSLSSSQPMDLSRSQEDMTQIQHSNPPAYDSGRGAPPNDDTPMSNASTPTHQAAASSSSSSAAASIAASSSAAVAPLELPPIRELPPIKLGKTTKERILYEQLGDLYSLIVTTEHLELSYVRDAITESAYASTCSKLIAQYKTLRESMGSSAPDLEAFCREYGLEARAGENRLKVGVPATVVHGDTGASSSGRSMEVAVFHAVQHFITMMDSLKLNMRAVDELHPTLTELVDSVNKVPGLPQDHESKTKTLAWLTTLHTMKAHEELSEEQTRQMSFDLDSAYNAFHRFVQGK